MNLSMCYRGGSLTGKEGYLLRFNYDEKFIEDLKQAIPHTLREWRPEEKLWWVATEYDATLQTLFANFYALVHQQGVLL